MQIITTHERTDMDGLASMYAAHLLYPEYQVVLPVKMNRNLREFLALYQQEMPFVERRHLPKRSISEILLVDTQAIAPLRGMDRRARLRIIDHHLPQEPASEGIEIELAEVGACTTLLVERLQAAEVVPDRLGATLMLMGIYEDTGSLTYRTTTFRDAQATAWLMAQGADLDLLHQFLHQPLTDQQRDTLERLIDNNTVHTVQGRTICIAPVALEHYVDELAGLIHPLMDVFEPEACFVLAEFEGDVQIIARSTTDVIDVAEIMRAFGGGGHTKAAAARAENTTLDEVTARLLTQLRLHVAPPVRVRALMSTNVHTLDTDISIRDAAQLMRRYGHEGFPVVHDERLLGVVTRSDVDRAMHHRLGDMPVRSVLHTGPLYVRPDDPVDEVQRVMIEYGLGQVPVVDEGRFVGIVTRTDLINLFAPTAVTPRAQALRQSLDQALPEALRELLLLARDAANDLGYSLYIVGGFVRDLLLGAPNLDLDLVVEGDAIRMAQHLAPKLDAALGGPVRVRHHARFGTAKLILDGQRPEGVPESLDFVTARTEFYEQPSALPTVERSSIKQDLYRRDFTINTLAICLDRDRYGELLDYYGGERDLAGQRIRVLHNLSFVEDPTRILRAVRFEQRLGFEIETRSAELIDDALDLVDRVTGERLRHELYLILQEPEPERSLARLARMGVLERIHPSLTFGRDKVMFFQRLREQCLALPEGQSEDRGIERPELSLCYLALLTSSMDREDLASITHRLRIRNQETQLLLEVSRLRKEMDILTATIMLPSTIYRLLHPFSAEARFVISVLCDSDVVRQRLALYQRSLATIAPRIDGRYLRSLGIAPGPIFGQILERVQDALLDGQIVTLEEEQALARSLAEHGHNGH